MTQYWQEVALILGLILVNAFFAAGEIAVISARPVRVKQLAEQGNRAARALLRLTDDHSRFLATIQVGITLAGFLASASAAVGLSRDLKLFLVGIGLGNRLAETVALLTVTVGVAYVTLVLGELVPKRMALQAPESIAMIVARPVELLARLTAPFTLLLTWSTNTVVRMLGGQVEPADPSISEEELRVYVEEHRDLQAEEKRLIAGVFEFGDRLVRHIMVPRTEMECLHEDLPLGEAVKAVRQTGFWRYPVYREDYDDIVGIVTVKDLLHQLSEKDPATPVSAAMREAVFVPEAKRALEMLKQMQAADIQMAIVVDEYGGVAGLVTLEDLLQEIVGEVVEEHLPATAADRVEIILDAAEDVAEVAEQLQVSIPESPHYETLAGYILHTLGAIPGPGDAIEVGDWRLVVEEMDGHRIDKVRAVPLTVTADPAPVREPDDTFVNGPG